MATTICKQLPQYDIVQQLLQSENLLMVDNIQDILNPLISIWAVAQKEDNFYYFQVNKFSPSPRLSLARSTFMLADLVKFLAPSEDKDAYYIKKEFLNMLFMYCTSMHEDAAAFQFLRTGRQDITTQPFGKLIWQL